MTTTTSNQLADRTEILPALSIDTTILTDLEEIVAEFRDLERTFLAALKRARTIQNAVDVVVEKHPLGRTDDFLAALPEIFRGVYPSLNNIGEMSGEWEKLDPDWSRFDDVAGTGREVTP